ncbi:hypothetical protein N2152v2_010365 [Parachlorella kessleri]
MEEPGELPLCRVLEFEPAELADFTLRTSDGYILRLHRVVLSRGCTLWKDLLAQSPVGAEDVSIEETWEELRPLLLFLYPEGLDQAPCKKSKLAEGVARAAKSSPAILNEITPSTVRGFLEVARKYGCDGLLDSCTSYLCSDKFKLTADIDGPCSVLTCLALASEYFLDPFFTKCAGYLNDHVSELAAKLHSKESEEAAAADLTSLGSEDLAALVVSMVKAAGTAHAQLVRANRQLAHTQAQLAGMTSVRDTAQANCKAKSKQVAAYRLAVNQLVTGFEKADSLRNKIHCRAKSIAK